MTNGASQANGDIPETGEQGKSHPNGKVKTTKYGPDGHSPLHIGEDGAGTSHPAADGISNQGPCPGGLNVALKVEIDNHSHNGETEGYGLSGESLRPPCYLVYTNELQYRSSYSRRTRPL